MFIVLWLFYAFSFVSSSNELMSKEELSKLPLKKLRALLDEKNFVCEACSEKSHYVDRVFESQTLPPQESKKKIPEEKKVTDEKEKTQHDPENIQEVII
jgi:hypothetical protein